MEKYDLIVIGAGPAGEKGASKAAQYGKRVALIERAPYLGGAGINTGTVPSKTLRASALYFSGLRQRGLYGIDYSLKDNLTVKDFMYRERAVVHKERSMIEQAVRHENITLLHGEGSLKDAHTVRIRSGATETGISADVILIATGSSTHHPPEIPFDGRLIIDSDTILNMQQIPKTMAVIGGGVIGTEYASIFTALGIHVTLIEPRGRIVSFVDSEICGRLTSQLKKARITPEHAWTIVRSPLNWSKPRSAFITPSDAWGSRRMAGLKVSRNVPLIPRGGTPLSNRPAPCPQA